MHAAATSSAAWKHLPASFRPSFGGAACWQTFPEPLHSRNPLPVHPFRSARKIYEWKHSHEISHIKAKPTPGSRTRHLLGPDPPPWLLEALHHPSLCSWQAARNPSPERLEGNQNTKLNAQNEKIAKQSYWLWHKDGLFEAREIHCNSIVQCVLKAEQQERRMQWNNERLGEGSSVALRTEI